MADHARWHDTERLATTPPRLPLPAPSRATGKLAATAAFTLLGLATAAALATLLLPLAPHLPQRLPPPVQRWLGAVAPEPQWHQLATGPWIEQLRQRGVLVAAVRHYRRPAPPGEPSPAEPDNFDDALARFIAQRLGVRLDLVDAAEAGRQADLRIAGSAPDGAPAVAPAQAVATTYTGGAARLVTLRAGRFSAPADLRSASICVQHGSPYAHGLAHDFGARLVDYPSGVHAAYGFMSGECQLLAEDEAVIERLMKREEWRFYRELPIRVPADDDRPQLVLSQGDEASARYLDQVLRYWKTSGALLEARERRVGNITFEVTQLQDGLICHA